MNKITMALIGIVAAGAIGAGGYVAFKPSAPDGPGPAAEVPSEPSAMPSPVSSGDDVDTVGRSLYGTPFEIQLWVREAGTDPDRKLIPVGRGICYLTEGTASSCVAASDELGGDSAGASIVSSGNGTLQLKLGIQILIRNAFLPDQATRRGIGAEDSATIPASTRGMALSDFSELPMRTKGVIAEVLLPPDSLGFEVSVPFHHQGDAGEDITDADQVGLFVARFVPLAGGSAGFFDEGGDLTGSPLSVVVTRLFDGKTETSTSVCSLTVETPCIVVHEGKQSKASMQIQALGNDAVRIALMIDDLGIDLLPLVQRATFAGEPALAVTRPKSGFDSAIPHVPANRVSEILVPGSASGREIVIPYVIGPKPDLANLDPQYLGSLTILLNRVKG